MTTAPRELEATMRTVKIITRIPVAIMTLQNIRPGKSHQRNETRMMADITIGKGLDNSPQRADIRMTVDITQLHLATTRVGTGLDNRPLRAGMITKVLVLFTAR